MKLNFLFNNTKQYFKSIITDELRKFVSKKGRILGDQERLLVVDQYGHNDVVVNIYGTGSINIRFDNVNNIIETILKALDIYKEFQEYNKLFEIPYTFEIHLKKGHKERLIEELNKFGIKFECIEVEDNSYFKIFQKAILF